MRFSVILDLTATVALAALPELPHDLFTLACLEIGGDPLGPRGLTSKKTGSMTSRTWAIGAMGFIEYEVDEEIAVVTITNIVSIL